jgi:hypothetical protein
MRYVILAVALAPAGVAYAGHEFPFYPSFYPQEITVEALDAPSAAQRLAKGTLHAYAGALKTDAAKTGSVASLGGYVVATFERDDCAAARSLKPAVGAGAVSHPYPVTPFHADYLHHADRAEAARNARRSAAAPAKLEVVDVDTLMAGASMRYNGWLGPAWIRRGWFHAYLLLGPALADPHAENVAHRLMRGEYRNLEERINLERQLVALLQAGCKRVVVGYTVRREHFAADYSAGVENVGHDALGGLASAVFPRTVKLRDFPWNGWLHVAAAAPPSSPWNPLAGGFDDAFGRLVFWALFDPAFLPSPHGAGWLENRVNASSVERGKFVVPEGALFSRADKTATTRIVYRVRNSAFHDGTTMGYADVVHAYALANKNELRGVRLLRVETETLAFGEDKLSYEVPVVEVYLDGAAADAAPVVAPPWTTLPWHAVALYEEAARRGYVKLADFDPVRDAALARRLGELARELEQRGHVPQVLMPYVTAQQAKERYARLREFHAANGHWLVTNGPYLLKSWDGKKAVLSVFRDPTYPKGLGSFNAYAVPLNAHVTRVERRADGALVHTEAEWLERLGRETRVVRGSFAQRLAERVSGAAAPSAPVCRYLLVRQDGGVAAAGAVRAGAEGTCRLQFKAAGQRLIVAAVLDDGAANAPIKIVPWE